MIRVLPSILGANHGILADEVCRMHQAGADALHMDVMDGVFVPNFGVGTGVFHAVKAACDLPLDVHLMITEPARYINKFRDLGAQAITIHPHACTEISAAETLAQIRKSGARAGLAISPDVPISDVAHLFAHTDIVLVMTVQPGFGGQAFLEYVVPKIAELGKIAKQFSFTMAVDGSIKPERAHRLQPYGVTDFVIGTRIFTGNAAAMIADIKKGVHL
jgi:ribulose-phosphate 3-epimerase